VAVFRFTSEYSGAQEAVNVWHFMTAGAPTTTQANEAIQAVDAFFTAIPTFLAAGTWNHGQRVTTVDQTPNFVVAATPQTSPGTGGSPAPRQVAAGVSWNTAFIGRSFRGRNYIGPLSSSALHTDGLTLVAALQTALVTAATALMAPTTNGAQLCVWSETLQQGNAVIASVVRSGYRTQRRRLT
jgi:hypothetical protein